MTPDGTIGMFVCGLSSTVTRVITRINVSGIVDTFTTYSTSAAAQLPRGVGSNDGSFFWVSDVKGDFHGSYGGALIQGNVFGLSANYGSTVFPLGTPPTPTWVALNCGGSQTVPW